MAFERPVLHSRCPVPSFQPCMVPSRAPSILHASYHIQDDEHRLRKQGSSGLFTTKRSNSLSTLATTLDTFPAYNSALFGAGDCDGELQLGGAAAALRAAAGDVPHSPRLILVENPLSVPQPTDGMMLHDGMLPHDMLHDDLMLLPSPEVGGQGQGRRGALLLADHPPDESQLEDILFLTIK